MKLTLKSVMFFDGSSFLGYNVPPCGLSSLTPSASKVLTVGFDYSMLVPLLLSHLKSIIVNYYSRNRLRRRTSPFIEDFSAGPLRVSPAWFVLVASPNLRSLIAASKATNKMTEQRRCTAA